jgi:[histone H3]-lysine36 N-trimethyltransferase
MEDEEYASAEMDSLKIEDDAVVNGVAVKKEADDSSFTPNGSKNPSRSPSRSPDEVKQHSDSASTPEPAHPSKLSRKPSKKIPKRETKLFDHLPDATSDACKTFQTIPDCLYGSKKIGSTDGDEAYQCDCRQDWRKYSSPKRVVNFGLGRF